MREEKRSEKNGRKKSFEQVLSLGLQPVEATENLEANEQSNEVPTRNREGRCNA